MPPGLYKKMAARQCKIKEGKKERMTLTGGIFISLRILKNRKIDLLKYKSKQVAHNPTECFVNIWLF